MTEAAHSLQDVLIDLRACLARVEAQVGSNGSESPVVAELSPMLVAYDESVAPLLSPFVAVSAKLGNDIKKLAEITVTAFAAQRAYLAMASQCRKPAVISPDHLKKLQACEKEVSALRDNRSEHTNHQNMVYEGIQALGWVCIERTPKPFIESFIDGLDFGATKSFKRSDPDHVAFVVTFKAVLTELMNYVKIYHTTGVAWNHRGVDTYFAPIAALPTVASTRSEPQRVMQERRMDCDDSDASTVVPKKPTATITTRAIKKPVCEERYGTWRIEHQTAVVRVENVTMKQQVYIFGCDGATIVLEDKAKSLILDSCRKTQLVFDAAVSSLEVVNCKSVQVQCKGIVPSIAIDKTIGCLVYLSWEGRNVQFVTSMSSEMNVVFPLFADRDECVEKPIPEQFVHRIAGDLSIISDVSDLYLH